MVKQGAVVIDVGVNRVEDSTKKSGYRLIGDVEFEEVSAKASAISPVPGGVGPMTITMLLHNVIQAAKRQKGINQ
jgi:methylenetetrahydrofolate dehydrogenase (NADP+)/methenyltetrahydrofolate cyclohydrolase